MKGNNITSFLISILLIISLFSCKKYLDLKPDKKLAVPSTVKDLQALLDNSHIMNQNAPSYDEASADNYFIPLVNYNQMGQNSRNAYIWENYDYDYPNDWANIYKPVYVANVVLKNIHDVPRTLSNAKDWDNVMGSALTFRSEYFLKALWIWAKAYDEQTADMDLGIVLRLDPDFNAKSERATVKECYHQIINDLMTAFPLLPDNPVHVVRPSKQSAYALLARTYLSMRMYDSAYKYSDLCLQLNHNLMDYNFENVDDLLFPFTLFNKEVILNDNIGIMNYRITPGEVLVDSLLYKSYDDNDLRKTGFYLEASLFFPDIQGYLFKGTYIGDFGTIFTGITTAEILLTRAECFARKGDKENALSDLNELLVNRFKAGAFNPVQVASADDALQIILQERRKELVFRGLRWVDIKRLNKEGANIVLKRNVDGHVYTLNPNENRYALPLPRDIVEMAGMTQNPK